MLLQKSTEQIFVGQLSVLALRAHPPEIWNKSTFYLLKRQVGPNNVDALLNYLYMLAAQAPKQEFAKSTKYFVEYKRCVGVNNWFKAIELKSKL